MPHLAHMILAGVTIVLLAVMVMLMGMATCDLNPLNISRLSSSDEVATIKMLLLKIIFVLVATALNTIGNIQPAIMAIVMWGVVYYMFDGVSHCMGDVWYTAGVSWCFSCYNQADPIANMDRGCMQQLHLHGWHHAAAPANLHS